MDIIYLIFNPYLQKNPSIYTNVYTDGIFTVLLFPAVIEQTHQRDAQKAADQCADNNAGCHNIFASKQILTFILCCMCDNRYG